VGRATRVGLRQGDKKAANSSDNHADGIEENQPLIFPCCLLFELYLFGENPDTQKHDENTICEEEGAKLRVMPTYRVERSKSYRCSSEESKSGSYRPLAHIPTEHSLK